MDLNKLEATFLPKVQRHSERAACVIVALEDGAAIIQVNDDCRYIGRAVSFRSGVRFAIDGI